MATWQPPRTSRAWGSNWTTRSSANTPCPERVGPSVLEDLVPRAAISPPPEPSPLEGEGWEGGPRHRWSSDGASYLVSDPCCRQEPGEVNAQTRGDPHAELQIGAAEVAQLAVDD